MKKIVISIILIITILIFITSNMFLKVLTYFGAGITNIESIETIEAGPYTIDIIGETNNSIRKAIWIKRKYYFFPYIFHSVDMGTGISKKEVINLSKNEGVNYINRIHLYYLPKGILLIRMKLLFGMWRVKMI